MMEFKIQLQKDDWFDFMMDISKGFNGNINGMIELVIIIVIMIYKKLFRIRNYVKDMV